jgi:signal transduction histidine kinase
MTLVPSAQPGKSDLWRRWIADRGSQAIVVLSLMLVAYIGWQFFGWGGPGHKETIGDVAFWPVNLIASVLAFRVAWTTSFASHLRRAWFLIGLGLLAYLVGDVLQLVYESVLNEPPYPTFADAAYLAFYPLVFAGIMQFPRDRFQGFALVRVCLDAAATTVAAGAVVWFVTMASATESGGTRLQLAVSIAYPGGDLMLILTLTALAVRSRRILGSWALSLIKCSLVLYIVSDIIYGRMTLAGTYSGGDWVDAGWMFAIAMLAASANEQYRVAKSGLSPGEARRADGGFVFLPYVATAVTFGFALVSSGSEGRLEGGSLALLGAVLVIVLARLHWSTLDSRRNHRLSEQANADFFATISHELRTPLTAVLGYCELLADSDDLSSEAREFVRVIQRNAEREERIVADLLFLNSIDNFVEHSATLDVDLGGLVGDSVSSNRPGANQADIAFKWTAPTEQIIVRVDPFRMGQVIDNLLTNAIKFSGAGSAIQVTVTASPGTASVRVRDNGPGIPESEASHVFERLYRGAGARHNAIPGAGLGLAIARGIVETFDGTIYLEPHQGPGALFRIDLPTVSSRKVLDLTDHPAIDRNWLAEGRPQVVAV